MKVCKNLFKILICLFFFSCSEPEHSNPHDPLIPLNGDITQFSALQTDVNEITLTWNTAALNQSEFIIYKKTAGSQDFYTAAAVEYNEYEFADTAVSPNNEYSYRLEMKNYVGSALSDVIEVRSSDIPIPHNFKAEFKVNQIQLSWECILWDDIQGYIVERSRNGISFEEKANIPYSNLSWTDTNLDWNKFIYRVKSYNQDSESFYIYSDYVYTE